MNRYQKPAVFETLALSYVMGTLHGKARLRFEQLMDQHFYLRAVTQAYQQQMASLNALLPEEAPPARVWDAINQELKLETANNKTTDLQKQRSWRDFLPWSLAVLSSVAASVMVALVINLNQPSAYVATLSSPTTQDKLAVATVSREKMQIAVKVPDNVLPVDKKGQVATLWCLHKDKNRPPLRIGTLDASGEYFMPIDKAAWEDMATVSDIVISLESADTSQIPTQPSDKVVFSGALATL